MLALSPGVLSFEAFHVIHSLRTQRAVRVMARPQRDNSFDSRAIVKKIASSVAAVKASC